MTETPEMTLTEAAEWAGVGRSTIHKALTGKLKGRQLSGRRDEATGQWHINPAELERVFSPARSGKRAENVSQADPDTAVAIAGNAVETALLREMLNEVRQERDNLRSENARLLTVVERTTLMLTHEQDKPASAESASAVITPPPPAPAAAPASRPGFLARLKAVVIPPG